jgi:hypothetical protein
VSVLPVVAVEVAPAPSPEAPENAILLSACSRALPVGSCESPAGLADRQNVQIAATARVTWDGAGDALVAVRLGLGEPELTRNLVFEPTDRKLERWRSVGLTIATIVDELRIRREAEAATAPELEPETTPAIAGPEPPAPVPPRAPTASPPPVAPTTARSGRLDASPLPSAHELRAASSLEAGALVATGLAAGPARSGIYARAAHDVAGLPAFVQVRLAYSVLTSAGDPSVAWSELALGSGGYWTTTTIRAEADASLQLVWTSASARSPSTGSKDQASTWLPGVAVSGRVAWPSRSALCALAGVHAAWVMREVAVSNAGEAIGRVPAYSVGLFLGVRVVL